MSSNRNTFLNALFTQLESMRYLWLKPTVEHPVMTPNHSDIDLLVHPDDLPQVLAFINQQSNLVTCWRSEAHRAVYLQLVFADGGFLKLDLLTQLVRKQWNYLPTDYLFRHREWKNGIATYSTLLLFEHAVLFNYLNHAGLPAKYLGFFGQMPEASQRSLLRFFNGKYDTNFETLSDVGHYKKHERNNMIDALRNLPGNHFAQRATNLLGHLRKALSNQLPSPGRVITFSGVDGAGKTTLLNDLRQVLEQQAQLKVVVLRHRPSLLPILSAWTKGKQAAESEAARKLPRQGNNRSQLSSLLRFGYYFADYLLGQGYVWARYTLPGYTVIYDRYYFDFIVDGKRTNLALGEALPKWLYRFVAKPGLNIFLYADPAVIRQRKQELPAADIQFMTGRYRALFGELAQRYRGQYLCLENNDRQLSLSTILKHYAKTI